MQPKNDSLDLPPAAKQTVRGFTRAMRHEVGDFLQLVYSSVALLQKRLPAEGTLEQSVLTKLKTRAEACKMLLDTAHDYLSSLELNLEPVELRSVLSECVRKARVRYPHLEVKDETPEAIAIHGDRARLLQVVHLLLANACDAADHSVVVKLQSPSPTDEVELSVTDDGPPVPAEKLDDLFQPFVPQRQGRVGLGLGPARRIIELHGGRIAVESTQQGFHVLVSLPRLPPQEEASQVSS